MFVKTPKRQNNFSRAIFMLRNSTRGLDYYIFQAKLVLCLAIVLLGFTWLPSILFDSTSRSYLLSTKHSIIELTSDRYSSLYRDIETSRTTIVFFRFSGSNDDRKKLSILRLCIRRDHRGASSHGQTSKNTAISRMLDQTIQRFGDGFNWDLLWPMKGRGSLCS